MMKVTSDLYSEYLRYTNRFRHIPYHIDALKLVERRLLLTLNNTAKSKLVKSAKVVGYCVGDYHPHGDVSTYDALVGLVQRGFASGKGNWGQPGFLEDDKAGAMRYTNITVQKGLNNIITEFLDYVPWQEIEYAKEPLFFSNPIPVGLIGEGFITGIGVDIIKCPRYTSKDLFTRLTELLQNKTPTTIIPNIPGCDVYEETPGEFESILQTGKGSIQVAPKITVNYDNMIVHGRSPLKGFNQLIAFNKKHKEKNKQEYFDFVDLSGDRSPIEVQIYSAVKKGQITNDFVKTIWQKVSQRVNVVCNFINDQDMVEQFGIDTLLMKSYNKWKETHLLKLNDDHRRVSEKIFELDVVQVVRDIMQYNPTCKKVDDVLAAFAPHQQSFPQIDNEHITKVIGKYSIKALIEKEINQKENKKELTDIQSQINTIDQISYNRIQGYMK
jgi:DNA gyrase/topoisomerase IV subunit A